MEQFELVDLTAEDVADALFGCRGFVFLDSSGNHSHTGRYSFIGVEPFATFHVRNGKAFRNDEQLGEEPLAALRTMLGHFRLEQGATPFPFSGGAIGYIEYDFGQRLENLLPPQQITPGTDELHFDFYDLIFAFDHHEKRCVLFSSGFPEADEEARKDRAKQRARHALDLLAAAKPAGAHGSDAGMGIWQSNFTAEKYEAAVKRVQDYILAGDIYQANISQRFTCPIPASFNHKTFYKILRTVNPAPFSAFLRSGDRVIASSSPERFLRCAAGQVEARPIKGTARRAIDPTEDAKVARNLAASEKDRAENTMIVDLLRNDLSRVCAPGSVKVPHLCALETYEGLHHLTSVVTGELREGRDIVDLIAATFPGGSITGAPKLRAMDIITEIEQAARGLYCGAIGYLGFDGSLDLNIAIRTVIFSPGEATFQVGGGITLLSDPAQEYVETLTKAQRIFDAFAAHAGAESAGNPP